MADSTIDVGFLNSFRTEFNRRSSFLRTPSPPLDAVEPLSPVLQARPDNKQSVSSKKRKREDTFSNSAKRAHGRPRKKPIQSRPEGIASDLANSWKPSTSLPPPSPLDQLAAAAMNPTMQPPPNYHKAVNGYKYDTEAFHNLYRDGITESIVKGHRHSKRSLSEVNNTRPQLSGSSRPATSYIDRQSLGTTSPPFNQISSYDQGTKSFHDGSVNTSHEDAELLLSFSQGARNYSHQGPLLEDSPAGFPLQSPGESSYKAEKITLEGDSHKMELLDEHAQKLSYTDSNPADKHADNLASSYRLREQSALRCSEDPGIVVNNQRVDQPGPGHYETSTDVHTYADKTRFDLDHRLPIETPNDTEVDPSNESRPEVKGIKENDMLINAELKKLTHSPIASAEAASTESVPIFHLQAELNKSTKNITIEDSLAKAPSQSRKKHKDEVCNICDSIAAPINSSYDLWMQCNGCKRWFHGLCVGYKSEREAKEVDKFHCKDCEPHLGASTFVRKSRRAHAQVDYAGLHEGTYRTSNDITNHHYIQPIKDGVITFDPEVFPRMRPELVTAEIFSRSGGFNEPVLIPREFNPQPWISEGKMTSATNDTLTSDSSTEEIGEIFEYDCVYDDGQDKLDMSIPKGLTVRRVAELYGLNERVEVIDVKLQEGRPTGWDMQKWADYYEAEGEKPVHNVISLEVSHTRLGRLIRRPKVVRDLDLQDAVLPKEDVNKGNYPKVQFYVLMSVADCYTDFHIDFGGSSVYYTILKGSKTFFFIPPKKQHLKKYEEWCQSPNQNTRFLGNETKECYRVDLRAGDTMLIPSGWIHAVWTPANSLVIGGNFLTPLHYSMQIEINQIEKNTDVGTKFRYPYFQKVLWFAVIRYLEKDPVPSTVVKRLWDGHKFERTDPVYHEYDVSDIPADGPEASPEFHNGRYYSQQELDGWPDLLQFVLRTVLVSLGKVQGVSQTVQQRVVKSLPKGFGDHLDLVRTFACWIAWKRGNENIPAWAHPESAIGENDLEQKMSEAEWKKLQRQTNQASSRPEPKRRSGRKPKPVQDLPKLSNAQPPHIVGQSAVVEGEESKARLEEKPPKDPLNCFGIKKISIKSLSTDDILETNFPLLDDLPPAEHRPDTPKSQELTDKVFEVKADTPRSSEKPKAKACETCRKSKRRCVHDENGNVDPIKLQEKPVPRRLSQVQKRPKDQGDVERSTVKKIKTEATLGNDLEAQLSFAASMPSVIGAPQAVMASSAAALAEDCSTLQSSFHIDAANAQVQDELLNAVEASSTSILDSVHDDPATQVQMQQLNEQAHESPNVFEEDSNSTMDDQVTMVPISPQDHVREQGVSAISSETAAPDEFKEPVQVNGTSLTDMGLMSTSDDGLDTAIQQRPSSLTENTQKPEGTSPEDSSIQPNKDSAPSELETLARDEIVLMEYPQQQAVPIPDINNKASVSELQQLENTSSAVSTPTKEVECSSEMLLRNASDRLVDSNQKISQAAELPAEVKQDSQQEEQQLSASQTVRNLKVIKIPLKSDSPQTDNTRSRTPSLTNHQTSSESADAPSSPLTDVGDARSSTTPGKQSESEKTPERGRNSSRQRKQVERFVGMLPTAAALSTPTSIKRKRTSDGKPSQVNKPETAKKRTPTAEERANVAVPKRGKATTPKIASQQKPASLKKDKQTDVSFNGSYEAEDAEHTTGDQATLDLIKQLQAEDMGLRRRR